MTHDPAAQVAQLQQHLSRRDQPIAMLLGAGASVAAKDADGVPLIPAVRGMTHECVTAAASLGNWATRALNILRTQVAAQVQRDAADLTIEDLLSGLLDRINAMGEKDRLLGTSRRQLQTLQRTLTDTIRDLASPEAMPAVYPHAALASWIKGLDRELPIELFTTNYDLLLERALEDSAVPTFDGFSGSASPFFLPESLEHDGWAPARRWTRLWKLHGSINWARDEARPSVVRVLRVARPEEPLLILPTSQKYDQSRKLPYVAMLDRLRRVITMEDNLLLIAIGFSFADQHINEVLRTSLAVRERTHLLALQYDKLDSYPGLIELAESSERVLALGQESAIINRRRADWKLTEPVSPKDARWLDLAFDSNAEVDDASPLAGRFRLGDFYWFTRFLQQMSRDHA